ncbi:phosphoserine phosphatase [Altererythrobacter atlanticus]|uniref:Phosphoserine phosphatase n=1 Tax=Croceibacterium atlanticum TaxID=1267766 RepID=A0A0F7KQL8_9SPHN|nr:phosphoserine phosphatase SerB [Croceibacterium atlanticum]AKH41457.1 Phosphoserine phosphatase [Croceibacterium atlanticum]MBB5732919.1 phosphoserine phosphatase [Croceibacterium atlanticum]
MLIARLIADPATLETRLDAATRALEAEGLALANAQMLDHCGDVLQLELPGDDAATLQRVLDVHFNPSDAIIARDAFRVPDLFVSDMDSTMIGQECIDELADFAGIKPQIAAITERAMQGELDFEQALRERVALLSGLDEGAIDRCLAERIVPTDGARTLVATLKNHGCRTVLVTGGFHHFADAVADWIGFEHVVGNRLAVSGGKLSGELVGAITDSSVKEAVLRDEAGKLGDDALSMAAGDGANDIPMLKAAGYGIAYRAKPKARAAANGWVDRGDLTAILKLLNIPEHSWVA